MTPEEQYDLELNQASIRKCKLLKQKYSYRKQMDRIYKFYNFNPTPEIKKVIHKLNLKLQEVNDAICGIERPNINFAIASN